MRRSTAVPQYLWLAPARSARDLRTLGGAVGYGTGTGRFGLLNVLERQLSASGTTASGVRLLLTAKLQDIVEVAAEGGHVAVVGVEGSGLGDLQGSLVVAAGAGQFTK
jgi:hypothetical protein